MLLLGQIRLLTKAVPIALWFRELMVTLGVLARSSRASLLLLPGGARFGLRKPDFELASATQTAGL
jgi:hypothetical protein